MQTAFITGASSGFGAAIAERLVKDGLRVIASGRRTERLSALRDRLGEQVLPFALDVTDAAAVARLPAALPSEWQTVDLLVNNAGLALGTALAQAARLEDWEQVVQTNVLGLLRVTHAFLPGMVARNRGHVVNLGSVAANYPYPGGNVYGATKAFVQQFTLGLKADLVGTQVRVSDVQPGLVGGTEFSQVRFGGDAAKAAKVYEGTTPLTAADVAEAVSWIVGLPGHFNVNRIELMPTCQAPGGFTIKRE